LGCKEQVSGLTRLGRESDPTNHTSACFIRLYIAAFRVTIVSKNEGIQTPWIPLAPALGEMSLAYIARRWPNLSRNEDFPNVEAHK